ncbi:MAG: transposase [Pyrinomonadaceae bacterium]|nr:transposase [Pyrinomonadaceae bacterium]
MTIEPWDDNDSPLAYLITFRTYGSWLHGDKRFSVDTHENKNIYGLPKREPNPNLEARMKQNFRHPPVVLTEAQIAVVYEAVAEHCRFKGYTLHAVNVLSNHVHAVISADKKPDKLINELKSYSTRALRAARLSFSDEKIWSRGGSTKYLWKERSLAQAIEYVLYGQGNIKIEDD